ncbi:MAG TPA: MBL fold metallo-hydrolase [Solirubrobacterales bacterium]|nr:MBL fold metallo-hydrolase [Solirubrobacterales bacterium]
MQNVPREEKVAKTLGWASLGLGVAVLATPGRANRLAGIGAEGLSKDPAYEPPGPFKAIKGGCAVAARHTLERDVAPGIHRVENANVNWYVVEGEGGLTIVDAGVPASWDTLAIVLGELGRDRGEIKALVLTHAHFDHIGMAERLRAEWGVPVHVHENDVPLARKPMQYSHERARSRYLLGRPRALPYILGFLHARAFWPPPVRELRRYGDTGELSVPGAPRVVFTPGHTLGHCSLHFPDRDAVIAGDALVMLDPYTGEPGPRLVARAATADGERALRSLDTFAATGAATVLSGHGKPWRKGAEAAAAAARTAGMA